jgi:hypothetical protein
MTLLLGALLVASIDVIVIHQLDGREVVINTEQITQMIESREPGSPHKMLSDKVKCVIVMTDRRWASTAETCESIRKRLEEKKP